MKRLLTSCLSMVALGVIVLAIVMYISFAEPNVVISFFIGAGFVLALTWCGLSVPALAALADRRSGKAAMIGTVVNAILTRTDDPRSTAFRFGRILGWAITLVFAGATVLFAAFALALWMKGELSSNLSGAALLCGAAAAQTFVCYQFTARVGRTREA